MTTRQTDGKYAGYQNGDLLMCVYCGIKAQRVNGPGESGISASAYNGDAVCDACENAREENARELDEELGELEDELEQANRACMGKCDQCDNAMVNGANCHEHGCPVIARCKRIQNELDRLNDL